MGSPKSREAHGDGVTIVVVEVTLHQGARERCAQGEGSQVTTIFRKGSKRDAGC